MTARLEIKKTLAELQAIATGGFALAFHIRFTTPTFLFQTYPKDWLDYYSQNGLVMSDPTVAWGFSNTGAINWSELADQDTAGVMSKAAEYGLVHGRTCAREVDDSRSIGSFARPDREFTPDEEKTLCDAITRLHDITAKLDRLSPEVSDEFRKMSVKYTHSQ